MEDGRVDITFAELLQKDCWLLLKVTLRKLLMNNEHNNKKLYNLIDIKTKNILNILLIEILRIK